MEHNNMEHSNMEQSDRKRSDMECSDMECSDMEHSNTKRMDRHRFPSWIRLHKNWRVAEPPLKKDGLLRWRVYKETVRKASLVGYAETAAERDPDALPPGLLPKLIGFFARRRSIPHQYFMRHLAEEALKLRLPPEAMLNDLVRSGLLARWVTLAKDGVSPVSMEIGPGCVLEQAMSEKKLQQRAAIHNWIQAQQTRLALLESADLDSLDGTQEEGVRLLVRQARHQLNSTQQYLDFAPRHLPKQVKHFSLSGTVNSSIWPFSTGKLPRNYMFATEFLLAVAGVIVSNPRGFDWKELDEAVPGGIGGAKRLDALKSKLSDFVEQVTGFPFSDLGLISGGSVYSIYLSGRYELRSENGDLETRSRPGLYAVTNIETEEAAAFTCPGDTVICIGSKALLLKMYRSGWVGDNPGVLVIGIDGRIRRAYKKLLRLLAEKAAGLRFFAWVDADGPGRAMASELAGLLPDLKMVMPAVAPEEGLRALDYVEWAGLVTKHTEHGNLERHLGEPDLWSRVFRPGTGL
jgi:hypothetical protein